MFKTGGEYSGSQELAGLSEAKAEEQRLIGYTYNSCDTPLLKKHNAVFITLCFGEGTNVKEDIEKYESFMTQLIKKAGLRTGRVAYDGYYFEKKHDGKHWPHAHIVAYSTKDYRTGRTIAKIPHKALVELQAEWKALTGYENWIVKHVSGKPFQSNRIYNMKKLASYLTGVRNMLAPCQSWCRLPSHNLELLEKKSTAM